MYRGATREVFVLFGDGEVIGVFTTETLARVHAELYASNRSKSFSGFKETKYNEWTCGDEVITVTKHIVQWDMNPLSKSL